MRTPEQIFREERPQAGIEAAVADFRYPSRPTLSRWPAVAGLATALAIASVALRLSATPAGAAPLIRISQALSDAPAVVRRYELWKEGRWVRDGNTFWQEGEKRRYADEDRRGGYRMTRAFDGRRVWEIQYVERYAKISTEKPEAFGYDRYDDVRKMLIDASQSPSIHRTEKTEGEIVSVVSTRLAPEGTPLARSVLRAHREGLRPIDWTWSFRVGKTWQPISRSVWEFPARLPPETFAFNPPKGFDVYDADEVRDRARKAMRDNAFKRRNGAKARLLAATYRRVSGQTGARIQFVVEGLAPLPDSRAAVFDADGRSYPLGWSFGVEEPRVRKPGEKTVRLPTVGRLDGRPVILYEAMGGREEPPFRPPYRLVVPAIAPGPERLYESKDLSPQFDRNPSDASGDSKYREAIPGVDRGTFEFTGVYPLPGYGDEFWMVPKLPRESGKIHGVMTRALRSALEGESKRR